MRELIGTDELLAEIEKPRSTKRGVTALYAVALRLDYGQTDWPVVNHAIIARWSWSALKDIKRIAWRALEVTETL